MLIPLATVEEWDLLEVDVDGTFTLMFTAKGQPYLRDGRYWIEAWGTMASMSAISSFDGNVNLLLRRNHDDPGVFQHPHGWAFPRPGDPKMHYCRDAMSLCGNVRGYVGLCYPTFDPKYFDNDTYRCEDCLAALDTE